MNKLALIMVISVALIVGGIVLSVGADYGLIKESSTFNKALSFGSQGWTSDEKLAEWDATPGQTVTVQLTYFQVTSNQGEFFTVSAESTFGSVTTEHFSFNPYSEIRWSPNVENPVYLFTIQSAGTYTVWASATNPSYLENGELTFSVVVTNPPPYTLVVILGLVMLAIGIIVMVLGLFLARKTGSQNVQAP